MLLKSLELENFRQFYGVQTIDFAHDAKNNVTVLMGENTSGKTTLAQAFTWCFYGNTKFRSKEMLSIPAALELPNGQEAKVRVTINLEHNDTDYAIDFMQSHRKDALGNIKANPPVRTISYKASDGQTEYVDDKEHTNLINEILPESLSAYFFFDGERIDRMSREIQEGKSRDFENAVKGLLGLGPITEAMNHLKSPGSARSVIGDYQKEFNSGGDEELVKLTRQIEECDLQIERVSRQREEAEEEKSGAHILKMKCHDEIEANKQSKQLAEQRNALNSKKERLLGEVQQSEVAAMKAFQDRSWRFFIRPLMLSAEDQLRDADVSDKAAVPNITSDTIGAIIKQGKCICGTKFKTGSDEFHALTEYLKIVPPQDLGSAIRNYQDQAKAYSNDTTLFQDVEAYLVGIRTRKVDIDEIDEELDRISRQLEGMKNITELENQYRRASQQVDKCETNIKSLDQQLGKLSSDKKRLETSRNQLNLTDDTNKRLKTYIAYANYMWERLKKLYDTEEVKTRQDLQDAVNELFQSVFAGSFTLELDEKYRVNVIDEELDQTNYDPETSEAQSIAVIFAFIAGVIKLARDEGKERSEMLLTEAYPLVMDAPLSNFDKKRIKAVCNIMPRIAEQVVIFIKDTDGELAEEHMSGALGARYIINVTEQNRKSLIEKRDQYV